MHTKKLGLVVIESPLYYVTKFCVLLSSDQIRSDQSLSRVRLFATPWIAARQASLSITNSRSSLRLMSIESVMPSSHLILCRPLLLLPPIPPSKIPGLISFKMDWLDLTFQLSRPYMTTGKTIAFTRRTFVSKIMSLLLKMLSRLVITFLPRSKRLLISWLQSPSAVILEPWKIKSDTVSPSISLYFILHIVKIQILVIYVLFHLFILQSSSLGKNKSIS